MKGCIKSGCIFHWLTKLANIALILFAFSIFAKAYGPERFLALLFVIPPLLSLIAIRKCGDKEERALKARIRKAHLRKELNELKEFDKSE